MLHLFSTGPPYPPQPCQVWPNHTHLVSPGLHLDGLDQLPLSTDEIDDEELDKTIVQDDYEYTKKLELGKKVYEIINKREVDEHSLIPEYKEALDLYMKNYIKYKYGN